MNILPFASAGVERVVSPSLFLPSCLNVSPVARTYTSPSAEMLISLSPAMTGELEKLPPIRCCQTFLPSGRWMQ